MKKMTKVISLALALVMCLALCACGQKDNGDTAADGKKTFVMGVDPEYPPFSYLGDDGKYTGFDVEIAQAACDLLGWDLQVFGVNWDQKLVQLGDSLVGLIRRSKGRDNKTLAAFADAIGKVISKFEF